MENKITKGTIIRTACLFLTLVNAALAMFGKSPLPIDDAMIEQTVSALLIFASSVAAWWKNNSFTIKARKADAILRDLKKDGSVAE
jgi:SPP1 family holin